MRMSVRYNDNKSPSLPANRPPDDLVSVDLYVNTRDDLIRAQHVINALLSILPAEQEQVKVG